MGNVDLNYLSYQYNSRAVLLYVDNMVLMVLTNLAESVASIVFMPSKLASIKFLGL